MTSGGDRLQRALEAWMSHRASGTGTDDEFLARNPDLRDLLEPLLADDEAAPAASDEGVGGGRMLGDYRLVREIGRGGMGVVWEARQTSLGRTVAVKLLGAEFAASPTRVARFKREALTLARLAHEGIVRVLDVDSADGVHWFAMELIDGEGLDVRMAQLRDGGHRGDSLRRMVVIVEQVARALHHAHAAGIVHRDIKPSNVLLRADGRAVLGDFGLAREAGLPTVTVEGAIAGTPDYMAPELVVSGSSACDARSDVFSLGATLYEALTFARPFQAATATATLERIVKRDPVDPRRLDRSIPADLAAIVLRALEKAPERRYPTAARFADDLRAFLELRPVEARRVSRLVRLRRWCQREPLRASLALVLLLGVPMLAGLGGYVLASQGDILAGQLARDEERFEALLADGFVASMSGNRDESVAAFESALALRPDDRDAIAGLVLARSKFDGPDVALALLEPRLAVLSVGDELRRLRVFVLRRLGRDDDAMALETELGPPRTSIALAISGAALILPAGAAGGAANARTALPLLSRAVRLAPRPRAVYVAQWATCAKVAGDEGAMVESAETLLAHWPERAFAWHIAAHNLAPSDPARALACQDRAIELGLDHADAHVNRSLYLGQCGRLDEALAAMRTARQRFPRDPNVHRRLLDLLQERDDLDELRAACDAFVSELPDDPHAQHALGKLLLLHGDRAEGLERLERAVRLAPERARFQHDVGVGYDAQGELRQAIAAWQRTIELEPNSEQGHAHLIELWTELDEHESVRAELVRWVEVVPRDASAHAALARFLLDRPEPSADDLARALDAALEASRLAGGKHPVALELVARAFAANGAQRAAELFRARAAGR